MGWARATLLLVAGLTLARLAVLFATPLELYPDEAQYWLWSRELAFGYFSKPPMVAWAIWATTALGGDAEAWVRASAPLFHAVAALAVFGVGRRLHGEATGFAAAVLYSLMPGVQLSAAVIATDAPLLCFIALTLLAYVELPAAEGRRRLAWAVGFGAALGLAFLSKYAALYALLGAGLHLALSSEARKAWSLPTALLAAAAFLLILAPNLVWNAQHDFATVEHTAANAAWGGRTLFNPAHLAEFFASQFGVFGPIPFAALLVGLVWLARRRRIQDADRLLLCFILPPLVVVLFQAFVSRANANWSSASYVAGSVLVAAWLLRWRARGWLLGAVALQGAVAALFLVLVIAPPLAEPLGLANSFKRAKGWAAMTDAMIRRAATEPGLSAVAVNDRFLFNAAAYYGRGEWGAGPVPPLVVWLRADRPMNQAEIEAPLTPDLGRRVLAVSLESVWRDEMAADFAAVSGREIVGVRLDSERRREAEMFVGEGYAPRPRDPRTGLPTPP